MDKKRTSILNRLLFQRTETQETPVEEYARWVNLNSESSILDFNTSYIFEIRDEIEDNIKKNHYSAEELKIIHAIDEVFKQKSRNDLQSFQKNIAGNSSDKNELEDILKGVNNKNRPDLKGWWYHLFDI